MRSPPTDRGRAPCNHPGHFGTIDFQDNRITCFDEKPPCDGAWINGGYFVLERSGLDYIEDDSTVLERARSSLSGRPICVA